jgi:hypothetical protein
MRTTLDLESPILEELKRAQREEGVSLGTLASRLLADALKTRRIKAPKSPPFLWNTARMGALIDLGDKDAVYRAMDRA